MFKEYKIQDQRCEKELERGRTNPWKDPDIIWTKHYQQSKFFAFKLIQNNSSLICCRIKTEQNTNPNYRNECEKCNVMNDWLLLGPRTERRVTAAA